MNRLNKVRVDSAATDPSKEASFKVAEAYKAIRTNLLFSLSATGSNVLFFTSYEPDAGKSTTSANIAVSMGQTGAKVLLIDADMRNCSQQRIFRVRNTDGLSKLLSGMCNYDPKIICRDVAANLDLLPAGPEPPNPSELLGSDRMRLLLEVAGKNYDYVFIDTPPIGVVSDALSLVTHVKNVVIIAREHQTKYDQLRNTVSQLRALGGKVLGTVLTDVSSRIRVKSGTYSYYATRGAKNSGASVVGYDDGENAE